MDKQEYLNQIATSNRPVKKSGNGILSSKFFIVGVIGVAALILIAILGAALGGGKGSMSQKVLILKTHIENTSSVIQEYQPLIKSSNLRSISASLTNLLANATRDLNSYIGDGKKGDELGKNVVEELTLNKDGLASELFEAKINGILDRIYAHKMAYEIDLIMGEEAQIINSSKDEALTGPLTDSYQSLEKIYDQFNNFSETK